MSKEQSLNSNIASSLGLCPIKDTTKCDSRSYEHPQSSASSSQFTRNTSASKPYHNESFLKKTSAVSSDWSPQHLLRTSSFTLSPGGRLLSPSYSIQNQPSSSVKHGVISPSPLIAPHNNMYPSNFSSNNAPNYHTNLSDFNPSQLPNLNYQSHFATGTNMGSGGGVGAVLYPNQAASFYGNPSQANYSGGGNCFAAAAAINSQNIPFVNNLQPNFNTAASLTPQLSHNLGGSSGQLPSNLQRVINTQNFQTNQPQMQVPINQQSSNYHNMSNLNATASASYLPNNQLTLGVAAGVLDNDADWRFRRSKQMFEQAQKTHQQKTHDVFGRTGNVLNAPSIAWENAVPGLYGNVSGSNFQTNISGKTPYFDSNTSMLSSAGLANSNARFITGGTGTSGSLSNQDLVPTFQNQNSRGPPAVNTRQGWSKFKSKSFDQEDLMFSNQGSFNTGGGIMNQHSLAVPPQHVDATTASSGLFSNSALASLPVDQSTFVSVPPSAGGATSFSIPVDLAYKLHSTHQTGSTAAGATDIDHHSLNSNHHHSTFHQNSAVYSATPSTSIHELHSSHGSHSLDSHIRNKSVSFDIPNRVESLLDFEEASRLAQMFPSCAECQKLEQEKLLYRQALRIRKNNSDKTLNEYMRSGIDSRSTANVVNSSEDRRLKDLAQLISETFSERLLEEERTRDVPPPPSYFPTSLSRTKDSNTSLYTSVGQKIQPGVQRMAAAAAASSNRWSNMDGLGYEDGVGGGYSSMIRTNKKKSSTGSFGAGGGILRSSDYDHMPAYKDSSQYLNLEGLSLRGSKNSRLLHNSSSRPPRDPYSNSSALTSSSTNPFIGGRNAYASDMDSYLYDRGERYGSVNLARFNDIPPVISHSGGAGRLHPNQDIGGGDKRRNLKDIRYSRDYEFIPRAEDMAASMGGGGGGYNNSGRSRSSKGSLSPTVLDSSYGSEMLTRRTSPRNSSRRSEAASNNATYAYKTSCGTSHRRNRSSSMREVDPCVDIDGYHRSDSLHPNSAAAADYNDHHIGNGSSNRSSRQHSQRRYGSVSSTASHYNTSPHYNFVDDYDAHRRGSSSDSVDRLSSPERVSGHQRSSRRFHAPNNLSSRHSTGGAYDEKFHPRRSATAGFKDDPRQQTSSRNSNYSSVPTDHMPSSNTSKFKSASNQPPNDYAINDGGAGTMGGIGGPDRQKLSDVPPNHSTESGYSSQSQHAGINRDDGGRGASGMMNQQRVRVGPHPNDPNNHNMGGGANMGGTHMPRNDENMGGFRPKDR